MTSTRIYKYGVVEEKLSDLRLKVFCGVIVHDIADVHAPLKSWQLVKPIAERRFKLGSVPQSPIIKLAKKAHVESFFDSGSLQLGSFEYYNAFDHPEIGDNQEGNVTLIAKTRDRVFGGKFGSGYNQLVLCTFTGEVDHRVAKRFGYNCGIVIKDPVAFARAISTSLGARSHTFGRCLYRAHKAVLGFPGKKFNPYSLSHRNVEIVNAAKHFIKPERYSHQKEFRFLWELPADVSGARIFDCSSAIQYCSPLELRR